MEVLTQNESKKAINGKMKKPSTITNEQWEELDEKAFSVIQLCLETYVLREILDATTTMALWLKL